MRRCASALAAGTQDARLWYHAGVIAAALGRTDEARTHLERALALGPALDPVARDRAQQTPGGAPMSGRRRSGARVLRALVAAVVLLPLAATAALAHPLGNFTINHYAGIRVEPDRVLLDVVIDQAEIPTFQAVDGPRRGRRRRVLRRRAARRRDRRLHVRRRAPCR